MIVPKITCNPPNPAPSQRSTHAAPGATSNIAAPSTRKQAPKTGTIPTENAPPAMTPAPYSISQIPGMVAVEPEPANTKVSTAPATRGGIKLKVNLRTGQDHRGSPAAPALCAMARTPRAIASAPSINQTASQPVKEDWCDAIPAAPSAVAPIATPPHPGTAVYIRALHRLANVPQVVERVGMDGNWLRIRFANRLNSRHVGKVACAFECVKYFAFESYSKT